MNDSVSPMLLRVREREPESSAPASKSRDEGKIGDEDYDVIDHPIRGIGSSASASKSRDKGKSKEEGCDIIDRLEEEDYHVINRLKDEDYHVINRLVRRDDSLASASKFRDKGKCKEEDDEDVLSTRGNIESEIAAVDHQIDTLNERKSELQGTELLDKLDELHKKIRDLAKTVPGNDISTRKQALGRSGVDSVGERSRTRTGLGSRELSHSRYGRRQHGNHDASVWGHAPEH